MEEVQSHLSRMEEDSFSTSHPRSMEHNKGIISKLFQKDSHERKSPTSDLHCSKSLNCTISLKGFMSLNLHDKSKSPRRPDCTKYFDDREKRVRSVESADENAFDPSKLVFGRPFAHGAHSQLYSGIYKKEPVAVKVLGEWCKKQFTSEVIMLSSLNHPNIIKFVGTYKIPAMFCIVTEYLQEGSLRSYLNKSEPKSLPIQMLISMALDIARGMEYVHLQGVIHRDLRPDNILITKDFHLKVSDFGIACEEEQCHLESRVPGAFRWMAPEMLEHNPYGHKVDVYAFGHILWELVSGTISYMDKKISQIVFGVGNKNLRPVISEDCPPTIKALIEQCWRLQPEKRPEFSEVVKVLEEFASSLPREETSKFDQVKILFRRIQKFICPTHQNR